ncbi:two-component system sensor histidine kinase EvgS [Pseudomonas nitritireducens]|uniref:histidine kinase n=1 Tax=Pseudomonas nitroreducens TaxID=46680 RepID=A0A7W7KJT8_PSENT|nr:transporter substrate-binding domain-containing protein [Pseudomonas nitritireducens]MBB4864074.1 two-component system sensor histidine kinase EvgS [Pseudomonas nitritireducens]
MVAPLTRLVLLLLMLLTSASAWAEDLQPRARQPLNELKVQLTAAERDWLRQRGELWVGVRRDVFPPYRIFTEEHGFEGIAADYLVALQRELGVPIRVRTFDSAQSAYAALHAGQIDLLASATVVEAQEQGLDLTPPFARTELSLFSEGGDLREYSTRDPQTRIAVAHDSARDLYLRRGGLGILKDFDSPLAAMAAVLTGEADVYLGDTFSTHYLSSQLFSNQLVVNQSAQLPEIDLGFATAPGQTVLAGILQRALGGLNRCQVLSAQDVWGDTRNCDPNAFRGSLSEAQRAWLAQAPRVKLAVSEDLAPYAFFNSRGRFNGIASDLLDLIRRKTGLRFEITRVSSLSEAAAQLAKGEATLSVLPDSDLSASPLLHSRALSTAPYLYVIRQADDLQRLQQGEFRVAVPRGYLSRERLAGRYPKARILEIDTVGEALKQVRDGEADMVLAPANVARYYLSYKYENSLKIGGMLEGVGARIVFAAPRDQAMLIAILDQAMTEIQPRQYLQITGRWRANSATDDKYWEGVAGYIWRSFEVLGVLLLVAGLLIFMQRRRIQRKRQDLAQRQLLLDELQVAKESAEKASRAKSVFLATMSHEIRTPLNAIIGMLELVLTRRDDPELNAQSVHIAYESAISLLALIGDILDISRIESSKLSLVPEPARMQDLLESVGNVFSGLARQKQLKLRLDIDALAGEQVWVDGVKVKQIVSNLVSNAIKFTERGEVQLQCAVEPHGDSALRFVVSVSDSGAGIPAAQLDQVFKPFFVVDGAVNDPNAGAGLGLAISQALCLLMGGELKAYSEVGQGTRMTFSVELERVIAEQVRPRAAASDQTAPEVRGPMTVLIVEDHLPSQYLLYQQISYLGHRVLSASNGLEALAIWQEQEIDTVITDCNMPEMDGHELTRSIRRLEQTQGLRPCLIIGLTADAQREELERCRDSGMDHALAKPINLAALNRLIPLYGEEQARAAANASPTSDIRSAMAAQVVRSNDTEQAALRRALAEADVVEVRRIAHKLKGTAYLLNHQGLLERCVEVEDLCAEGDREAIAAAVQELDDLLVTISQSLRGA